MKKEKEKEMKNNNNNINLITRIHLSNIIKNVRQILKYKYGNYALDTPLTRSYTGLKLLPLSSRINSF